MQLMASTVSGPWDFGCVRDAYDTVAEAYAALLPDTRAETPLDLAMVDAFAGAVTSNEAGAVLDAGCGTGRMSRYLADRGCRVEGVDLSPGMVALARRDHPDVTFSVGSLSELPFAADQFAGVMLWYSIIHTPPNALARVLSEPVRVLRPGGHLLVAFQSGTGTRDVSRAYRRFGCEVDLERHLHQVDHVASRLEVLGLQEVCRLVRSAQGSELDAQAALLAKSV
jgi:ubiquinone/menaquinone biosynthesis C-methylase UbiE